MELAKFWGLFVGFFNWSLLHLSFCPHLIKTFNTPYPPLPLIILTTHHTATAPATLFRVIYPHPTKKFHIALTFFFLGKTKSLPTSFYTPYLTIINPTPVQTWILAYNALIYIQ